MHEQIKLTMTMISGQKYELGIILVTNVTNNFHDNTIHLDDMKNWTQFELNHRTPVIIRCDDYNNGVITVISRHQ